MQIWPLFRHRARPPSDSGRSCAPVPELVGAPTAAIANAPPLGTSRKNNIQACPKHGNPRQLGESWSGTVQAIQFIEAPAVGYGSAITGHKAMPGAHDYHRTRAAPGAGRNRSDAQSRDWRRINLLIFRSLREAASFSYRVSFNNCGSTWRVASAARSACDIGKLSAGLIGIGSGAARQISSQPSTWH